jgi:hypothetical protein
MNKENKNNESGVTNLEARLTKVEEQLLETFRAAEESLGKLQSIEELVDLLAGEVHRLSEKEE